MTRTTSTAVKIAIDTHLTDPQIIGFIEDASSIVDDIASADSTISADRLTLVEKYLTCHLVTLRDPRLTKDVQGDIAETYQRDPTMTEYLKLAIALDPTDTIEDTFTDRPTFSFRVGAGYDSDLSLPAT